jgi:hypothetical protein
MTSLIKTCALAILVGVCIGTLPVVVYHFTDGACVATKTLASVVWSGGAIVVVVIGLAICSSSIITCALWLFNSIVLFAILETLLLVVVNLTFVDCYTVPELHIMNAVGGITLTVGWITIVGGLIYKRDAAAPVV